MNWLNRTISFAYRNYIFAKRSFFSFAEIIFWPVVGLFSIGLMGNFLKFTKPQLGFILSGVIAMGVLQVNQLDVAYCLLFDIWGKSIKHTFLSPTGITELMIGSWIVGIIRGILVFFILTISSCIFFDFYLPGFMPTLIFLIGLFLNGLIIGMGVCYFILTFGQRAEVTAWSLVIVVLLLAGIYYPVEIFPPFLRYLANLIPLTYFLEYFRTFYGFSFNSKFLLLKAFGLSFLYTLGCLIILNIALRIAKKKGTLIKLSE
ncbi:ABC transporter permease [Candidatus Aminicenantes bacterium AC-708-M15]|nr:ABC transporter permease [SCandidatus Aminicenantes bacterium Aminicenantia_JdfR_composite]MCP2596381.1 ABC transporter permease [Candidatus Aminicenantes bacterium AC-335-G13]MCP2598566.1 ABC transporter permease [Candidatus Aminicenantes bacterium AC-335-L06]MCP2604090.1 ABC transporter permease [Candidatus Aminicenantes bacterium AC-708-M15]MCP2605379.1 ABC transporter permease [Candidatus Aminicenantes bacterium AC-335-O07]MCP2606010.1 ABC transporter permease [Candidatus Aminicenantes 